VEISQEQTGWNIWRVSTIHYHCTVNSLLLHVDVICSSNTVSSLKIIIFAAGSRVGRFSSKLVFN